jgi:glycosyltransferase involved in cell wall biosynthesis
VDEGAVHVCYCHNPFRYAWNARDSALEGRNPLACAVLGVIFQRWRQWDWIAAQRVDSYIANSQTTRRRINHYFNREATVVYPPVEMERFTPGPVSDYYLVLSELMPHKRIELAIRAFDRLGWPLVIAGDGPDARRLHRMAGPTVHFEGRVTDARAAQLLAGARALVVTATEEFGIAAVESQAAGRPVIALEEGGVCETVLRGETGVFYDRADVGALIEALTSFDPESIDPARCIANAASFDLAHFRHGITAVVDQAWAGDRPVRSHLRERRVSRGLAPLRPSGPRRGP